MSSALAVMTLLMAPALVGAASTPRTAAGVRWAFGAVLLCFVAVVLHGLGMPREPTYAALAVLTLAAAVRCARTRSSIRIGHVDPLLAPAFALVAIAGALLVLSQPVQAWDGVAIWYRKTRSLLEWQPIAAMTFPPYPDLGPMGWSLLLAIAGTSAEPVGRLLFLGLYLAWLTSLALWLPSPAPARIRLVLILTIAAYVDLGAITNGYQDAVVMSVAGMSALLLGRMFVDGDTDSPRAPADERRYAALGLFFAGALGAIKVEGAVLGAILVGGWSIAVASVHGPRRLRPLLPFIGLWLALVVVWPLLLLANGVSFSTFQEGAYRLLSPSEMLQRVSRVPAIVLGFARLGPWYVLPIVASVLTSVAAWRRAPAVRPAIAWLWGCAIAHWAWIVTILLVTNWDFRWQIRTALDRLELQHSFVWPMATIVSAAALLGGGSTKTPSDASTR